MPTTHDIRLAFRPEHSFLPTGRRESISFGGGDSYKGIYDVHSVVDWPLIQAKQNLETLSETRRESYSNVASQVEAQKALIRDHVDRRVQLFFQQAILSYQTPFIFSADGTEDQMGSGRSLRTKEFNVQTQAAHSSTFPCLYASLKDAEGNAIEGSKFVYLKYSHAYRQHNGTIELPTVVNQTDTMLDGKKGGSQLRGRAIQIINRCAEGELGPIDATKEFLKEFKTQLEAQNNKLSIDNPKRQVVKIYLTRVLEIIEEVETNDQVFDWIMGVDVQGDENEALLREIVYRNRFSLIQQSEFMQSQIAKKILKVQRKIFSNAKSLKQVHPSLRYALLKAVKEKKDRRSLAKLFCTSLSQLESLEKSKTRARADYRKLSDAQKKEISNLEREVRKCFHALRKQEYIFRAQLFTDLRIGLRSWKQVDFVNQFKACYPSEPMSQAMVSRLEQPRKLPTNRSYKTPLSQRSKLMKVDKAIKIADTFDVDSGLFLPALFSSEYD